MTPEDEPIDDEFFTHDDNLDDHDISAFEAIIKGLWIVEEGNSALSDEQQQINKKKLGYNPYRDTKKRVPKPRIDWDNLPPVVDPGLSVDHQTGWVIDPNPHIGRDDDDSDGGIPELVPEPVTPKK